MHIYTYIGRMDCMHASWAESNQRYALGWVSAHVAALFHWYLRQSMNLKWLTIEDIVTVSVFKYFLFRMHFTSSY